MPFPSRPLGIKSELGFGVIEALVSVLLLAVLGTVVAGGLIQVTIANSRNVLNAIAGQLVADEVMTVQKANTTCASLLQRIGSSPKEIQVNVASVTNITLKVDAVGWTNCSVSRVGTLPQGVYPIRITALNAGEVLFSVESVVVSK